MLYTFSQANYSRNELMRYFQYITENDTVLLWQDGILLALKETALLEHCKAPVYAVEDDVQARGLTSKIPAQWFISQAESVELIEEFAPHFAL